MLKAIKRLKESKRNKIRNLAYDSAKIFYSNRSKTAGEFQAYQQGFMNAYTTAYIKAARKHNKV